MTVEYKFFRRLIEGEIRVKAVDYDGEPTQKKAKVVLSAGKEMATDFVNIRGIISIDYIAKGKTINEPYYTTMLGELKVAIRKKLYIWTGKSFVSPKYLSSSHVNDRDFKIERNELRIASSSTLFARSSP